MKINLKYFFLLFAITFMVNNSFAKEKKKKKKSETTKTIAPKSKKEEIAIESIYIEGVQANILGNRQEALNKFNEVLRRDTENDAAMFQLAKIYYQAGAVEQCVTYCQRAIKINPNNEYYYVYLAEALGEYGMYSDASKTYESLVKLKPKEYDYYFDWAYMLSQAKLYKESINVLNLVEQKTGISENLIMLKQPLWIQLNKIDEAVSDVEKLIELYPREENYYLNIAEIYEANNLTEKALQTYERLNTKIPESSAALVGIAEIYRKKNDTKKYEDYLSKVFDNKNIDIDNKILAVIPLLEKMGKDSTLNQPVLEMVEMIYKNHPNDIKAISAKADVLYNLDKKEEALEYYKKAIQVNPDSLPGTVWVQSYILAAELEKYDDLILISEKGIQYDDNDAFGYFYNAIAYQQKKQYQKATNSARTGIEIAEKESINNYNKQLKLQMLILLGDVSFELKDYTLMDSAYEAALEIDPNNATLLNNYAYYLTERDMNFEKAERMSKKSNLLVDNNAAFIDTYAWIMFKMKNYKEALKWIEEAISLPGATERPDILEHYGEILYKMGRKSEALQQWKNAIEKGADKHKIDEKIKNAK
jgi:tetratricopeptide (TPR) repeat protein